MAKYDPLADHLRRLGTARAEFGFAGIEALIGAALPASARTHRPWWANEVGGGHVQAHAWMDAGWVVDSIDLAAERVVFARRPQV